MPDDATLASLQRILAETQAELAREQRAAQRTARLQIVHDLDRLILAAHEPVEIARTALEHVLRVTDAMRVSVVLFDAAAQAMEFLAILGEHAEEIPPGTRWPFAETWRIDETLAGRLVTIPDVGELPDAHPAKTLRTRLGVRSAAFIPMVAGEGVIGSIAIARREKGELPPDLLDLLLHIADSLAIAIQNSRLIDQLVRHQAELSQANAQLQALSRRLITVQEDERRSLARELHDQVAQSVTGLSLGLAALTRRADCPPSFAGKLHEYQALVAGMMKELHAVVSALRPPALDGAGVVVAIEQYVRALRERYGIDAALTAEGLDDDTLAPEFETTLYRVVQEALTNVVRHAGATQVRVHLACRGDTLTATIEDNGAGFDLHEAAQRGRLGLVGMRERAQMLGGHVTIESAPGAGARVTVVAPCASAAHPPGPAQGSVS